MVNIGGPYLDYSGCIDAGRSEHSTQPMHLSVYCHWLILLGVSNPQKNEKKKSRTKAKKRKKKAKKKFRRRRRRMQRSSHFASRLD